MKRTWREKVIKKALQKMKQNPDSPDNYFWAWIIMLALHCKDD
jgi:hypothetical protein